MLLNDRTYLMLAHSYKGQTSIDDYFYSIKFDGMRAFWDGGISRGMLAEAVPYANIAKDSIRLAKPVSTGLWSRYGKVIHAPDWWLDQLPKGICLDGELYMGRGMFQTTVSITKKYNPPKQLWEPIRFHVFDSPSIDQFARLGRIRDLGVIFDENCRQWALERGDRVTGGNGFDDTYRRLVNSQFWNDQVTLVEQKRSGSWEDDYEREIEAGGEGLMFRAPYSVWTPQRTSNLLKYKPENIDTCEVVGWKSGRLTDKDSRWLGMIGALKVKWRGKEFKISGLNENERGLLPDWSDWARSNPDTDAVDGMIMFQVGDKISFKYGDLTTDGIPKRAVFNRV